MKRRTRLTCGVFLAWLPASCGTPPATTGWSTSPSGARLSMLTASASSGSTATPSSVRTPTPPPDKTFISFVGQGHMMVMNKVMLARMAHFTVAFFGTHLQGRQDLAQYYSADFVSRLDGLAWGVVRGE